jgi:hypothetical protein
MDLEARIPNHGPFVRNANSGAGSVVRQGFDQVRTKLDLPAVSDDLSEPSYLLRGPSAHPLEIDFRGFVAGNTWLAEWSVNGQHIGKDNQRLLVCPVLEAKGRGSTGCPSGLVAVPIPGSRVAGATNVRGARDQPSHVINSSALAVAAVSKEHLEALGVSDDHPLVCRVVAINAGPNLIEVGDGKNSTGGGVLRASELRGAVVSETAGGLSLVEVDKVMPLLVGVINASGSASAAAPGNLGEPIGPPADDGE